MRQQRTGRLVMAMMLMIVLARVFSGGPAQAADPDFTHVADILNGQRQLLHIDDLFIAGLFQRSGAIATAGGILQTKGSSIVAARPSFNSALHGDDPSYVTLKSARLFYGTVDDIVSSVTQAHSQVLFVPGVSASPIDLPTDHPSAVFRVLDSAVGDFTGDGYGDVAIATVSTEPSRLPSPGCENGSFLRLRIITAADPNDASKGLRIGRQQFVSDVCIGYPPERSSMALTAGDFNGDGRSEIALLENERAGSVLHILPVNPESLDILRGGALLLTSVPASGIRPSLAAGRFSQTANDQLVLAWGSTTGNATAKVLSFDVDAGLNPILRDTYDTGIAGPFAGEVLVRSGRFSFNSPFEQVAIKINAANSGQGRLAILSFGAGLKIAPHRFLDFNLPCSADLAVGNFDRMKTNPTPPPPMQRDPNLQLALSWSPACNNTRSIGIFNVDPANDFAISTASTFQLPEALAPGSPAGFVLAAGDSQGRSLVLGAPTKVTVTGHIQPDVVLGIPPMHIDFIRDVDNLGPTGKPAVLNLTVLPDVPDATSFSTQFEFSSTTSSHLSTNNSTSWGYSTGESLAAKVTLGDPEASFFSDEVKVAGAETHATSVADTYDTYESVTDSLSATTGFADHLFFTESRHNVYYYPVLGRKVCPAGKPSCTEAEKRPLFVQFSGVDLIEHHASDATTQEWYQPINEPGNLFSYPWSLDVLQKSIPNLAPMTTNPAPWRTTDTSTSAYSTTWAAGGTTAHTTGHADTHSFDLSIAVTAQVGAEKIVTAGLSGEYDYGTSDSASNLFTSEGSLDASTGIQVNKPDFGDDVAGIYFYNFAGYVLGRQLPSTIFDSKTVTIGGVPPKPVDIQSVGPLAVAFLADPVDRGAPWWRQAYTKPDLGLSHPARWSWSPSLRQASFNVRHPTRPPQNDLFYHMKGLFITAADGKGPQRSIVTEGERVLLQARVYNFSVADMPRTTTIRVRFYGQVYENAQLIGDSFLIGETSIGPIPGFNSTSTQGEQPNWALAGVPFETTPHADKNLVFWVLVWAEDAQRNLMPELEGHGLTANPGSSSFTQISQVPTEDFGNNVGLYGSYTPFFVAPKEQPLAEGRAEPGQLVLAGIKVAADHVLLLEHGNTVTVTVQNTAGTPLAAVPVVFYDGDPQQGGKVFDVQHIPRLRAHASYALRTFFRPTTCGDHLLFVRAGHTTASSDTAALDVQVTIDPDAYIDALIAKTTALGLPRKVEGPLVNKLDAAKGALDRQLFEEARNRLTAFVGEVEAQRGGLLTGQQVESLIGPARLIPSCVAL